MARYCNYFFLILVYNSSHFKKSPVSNNFQVFFVLKTTVFEFSNVTILLKAK